MNTAFAALRFTPVVTVPVLVALALIGAAVVGLALWRRASGAWLRAASLAVLVAWLAGPGLVRESRQGLRDVALLVVDQSASMSVGNRASLAAAAAADFRTQAAALPDLELHTVTVPEHGNNGTALWGEVTRELARIPAGRLAGVAAITDGQIHDLPPGLPAALAGAPLHLLLPASGEEWDRRVRIVQAPSYGLVGHPVTVKVVVEDLGPHSPGGSASLTISRDGAPPETQSVQIGQPQDIAVDIKRAGPTLLEFATPEAPGEASPLNNRAVVRINGVRDRLRVLLVSGEPNQDERTWRRLLKSDPAVDLVHFTILRPPERDDMTPLNELALIAFPTRELFQEKLYGFDLVILDRFTDRGVLPHAYLRNIATYVQRGGALLLTTGPEFAGNNSLDQTPLSEVLPAHAASGGDAILTGAFRPVVTDLGARHPVTQGLAGANQGANAPGWGPWYRAIGTTDVQGQVAMTGPGGAPLLVLSHQGEGRVALLLSDQIWLWSRSHEGGGPQAELLRRVAHWLMGEPDLDEDRLEARIDGGLLHVTRNTVEGPAAATVNVTTPAGGQRTLALVQTAPGIAAGSLPAATPGVWRVQDGPRLAFAAAGQDNPLEFADLRATTDVAGKLVQASGGGAIWLGASGPPTLRRVDARDAAAGPGWVGLRRRGAHLVTGVETVPLLPAWAALPLLLGLALAAWRREAR